ncbi:acetyltransferase [Halopseudomonas aestusnigri]|uniref:Sugar O-acyltransferase, sialic acid O-acetyltransferase NeuD family n=1 Tax=Halopseudomonas aestusnigri TaxID=857252 RepID=A0AAQ1JR03_9GAMM|nr:acetyltransferase [Halopseudomonas aestusnigri]MDL2200401.1 acetyltransferase [Halopseudomonas aestusnigri]OWL86388.1 acetyltransferase [Halopseudomonas aestusnigri]SEG56850.1 sugar O-acyltransferase, sialic acid O-acetyltransferase NeuD family [Halopseudomonas aestusnigri]
MKHLAVLGASGHGKVIADCAEVCGWDQVSFFDDRWPALAVNGHWPVIGGTAELIARLAEFQGVLVGIGNNVIRLTKLHQLLNAGAQVPVLQHPSAYISRYARIGAGSVVFAGAVINADSELGKGVIVNTGATVDHDCVLADGVHISPGANLAGGVVVAARSWVGIGASVRQLVQIGSDVVVGAGAAVVANTADGVTLVGVPARPR